jgi:sulfur-oxidizing protein SoxY
MKRREFLRKVGFAGVIATAVSAGLSLPKRAWAAWNQQAFRSKTTSEALNQVHGSESMIDSDKIFMKAPDIAENGAVVPITIQADLPNVESISLLVDENPNPLAAHYQVGKGLRPYVSTRIKMGKTSAVHAVVKADGQLMKATKEIKVTIGGCGG